MSRRSFAALIFAPCAAIAASACSVDTAVAATAACSLVQVETDPNSAIEPCSRIIEGKKARRADRGFALFIRGKGYHNTKRFDLAAQDYDAAIALTPKNEELLVSRANIALRGGRVEEGVTFLQKALTINPLNGRALRTMGAVTEQFGDVEEAERYYSAALASDPNDAYALLFRSKTYMTRQRFDDALKDATALVAIPAGAINRQGYLDETGDRRDFHIIALKTRAQIYRAIGRLDLAERDLTDAVGYRRSFESLAARGEFLAQSPGRDSDALTDLNNAIALNEFDAASHFRKGLVLFRLRQIDDAVAALDRALKLAPHFPHALRIRARLYREMDKPDAAVADMVHAIAIDPTILSETMPALRIAGYWRSKDDPTMLTPALEDAIRACMLDKRCN